MFLHVCVILFTGRGSPGRENPPQAGRPHPRAGRTPREQTPPEQTPPWEQKSPREQTPPGSRHPPRSRHPPTRSRHPPGADPPRADTPRADTPRADPPGSTLQHTVNERPVRILLECILVTSFFSRNTSLRPPFLEGLGGWCCRLD